MCVCQGINSNHAQTVRFNIPTSYYYRKPSVHVCVCVCVCVCMTPNHFSKSIAFAIINHFSTALFALQQCLDPRPMRLFLPLSTTRRLYTAIMPCIPECPCSDPCVCMCQGIHFNHASTARFNSYHPTARQNHHFVVQVGLAEAASTLFNSPDHSNTLCACLLDCSALMGQH